MKHGERFFWLASNSWGDREDVTHGAEETAEGSITINFLEGKVDRFSKYFLNLKPSNNKNNPWFEEVYQEILKCRLIKFVEATRLSARVFVKSIFS